MRGTNTNGFVYQAQQSLPQAGEVRRHSRAIGSVSGIAVGPDAESLAPFVDRIALGRPGVPEDISPAVLLLASEDARYINGATLTVRDGNWLIG